MNDVLIISIYNCTGVDKQMIKSSAKLCDTEIRVELFIYS